MSRLWLAGALSAVLSMLVAPPLGAQSRVPGTESARLRAWTVTLSYELERRGAGLHALRGLHLTASLRGIRRLDRAVPLPRECGDVGCVVFDGQSPALELADLAGEPHAVVWLWTGGAHCCSIAETISLVTGAVSRHGFGNHGASLARVGGVALFASVDDRFSYLYTSYAASANPLQLWRFRGRRFVDVTASYPGRTGADARQLWSLVTDQVHKREEARGAFAAWAADACRLSGRTRVAAAARTLVAAGAFSPPRTDPFGPTGARFPVVLLRDLTRFGYCRRA